MFISIEIYNFNQRESVRWLTLRKQSELHTGGCKPYSRC